MRRLFWDIETAPNVALVWQTGHRISVGHESILKERVIITIAWSWEHEKKVHALHWDRNHDDKVMLQKFAKVAAEADELVHQYGDFFDLKWFKTRCLFHRIRIFPFNRTIDTKTWASKYFYFNSNAQDYILKFLGYKGKIKMVYQDWKDVLNDKVGALAKMVRYNKYDVFGLKQMFREMSYYVEHATHVGVMEGKEKWTCPHEGSENVHIYKTQVTAAGSKKFQMQCQDCGHYYKINEASLKKYKKAKGR